MPVKDNSELLVPLRLKLPKPMERYTSETIELTFFAKRINEVTQLILGRKEAKIFLSVLMWEQLKEYLVNPDDFYDNKNIRLLTMETIDFNPLFTQDIKDVLKTFNGFIDSSIPYQYVPDDVLDLYDYEGITTLEAAIEDPGSIISIRMKPTYVKLIIGIAVHLRIPLDDPFSFISDLFQIPSHFDDKFIKLSPFNQENVAKKSMLDALNLFYSFFEYLSTKFSGIKEHFLKIAATLFWTTKITPTYSLEIFELLSEMFGEHKLETRSTQLYSASFDSDLLLCERKGKNKNRSIIYFSLNVGAEWIIAGLFPDARIITLQQAIAISFLRYSSTFLTHPWDIPPIEFNYLLDIWFRSFLYTNNLDTIVYQKANEHVRTKD